MLVEYLRGKGLVGKHATGDEWKFPCPWCGEAPDSTKRKLYVNDDKDVVDCLTGDTLVWTPDGRRRIDDLAGVDGHPTILDGNGRWVACPVEYFGDRETWAITVTRNKLTRTLRATDKHRWLVDGQVVLTRDLQAGQRLDAAVLPKEPLPDLDPDGVLHGILAGDGHRPERGGMVVQLTDKKLDDLRPWLGDPHSSYASGVHRWGRLPKTGKDVPDMGRDLSWLAGWLAGYIATDGTRQGSNISISSTRVAYLEAVRTIAARLGIATGPIITYDQTVVAKTYEVARVSLFSEGLPPELLLRAKHRDGYQQADYSRLRWRVTDVRPTGDVEPVFCAVVPTTQSFVIDELILTGNCKVCGEAGGINTTRAHFGDGPIGKATDVDVAGSGARGRVLEAATANGEQMLRDSDEAMLYLLRKRGLKPETIEARRLGFVRKGWSLTQGLGTYDELSSAGLVQTKEGKFKGQDFFYDHLLIPYIEGGKVVQLRGRSWGAKTRYMTGPGEKVRLFNIDSLIGADEVIIVEGEYDCMVLAQELAGCGNDRFEKMAVVGLPGTNALPDHFESLFDRCRRVYIAFDPDAPGVKAAEKIAKLLGGKARVLTLPNLPDPDDASKNEPDWSDLFVKHNWTYKDVMQLIAAAASTRIKNVADIARRLREHKLINTGLKTGFKVFDSIIEPGLQPGQIWLPLAKTGTGKTIFLCNLVYNTRSVPTLFFALEQTDIEVWERIQRIALFHHPRASPAEVEALFPQLWMCDDNRLASDDLSMMVEEFHSEVGVPPELLVVDYLGYYARGQQGSGPYEKVSNAVMQLKAEAKRHGMVVVAPHQVSRGGSAGRPLDLDDARDSGVVEETGDFVTSLYRPDDNRDRDPDAKPTNTIKSELLKSRHGGKGRTFDLTMDMLTLAMVDKHSPEATRARQHNDFQWQGGTYEQLRARQTKPIQQAIDK